MVVFDGTPALAGGAQTAQALELCSNAAMKIAGAANAGAAIECIGMKSFGASFAIWFSCLLLFVSLPLEISPSRRRASYWGGPPAQRNL
jgi:hypothetical protein